MTVANIDNDNCPNADNNMTSEIIWVSLQHTITWHDYLTFVTNSKEWNVTKILRQKETIWWRENCEDWTSGHFLTNHKIENWDRRNKYLFGEGNYWQIISWYHHHDMIIFQFRFSKTNSLLGINRIDIINNTNLLIPTHHHV